MPSMKNPFKSKTPQAADNIQRTHDPLTPSAEDTSARSPRRSVTIVRPIEPEYKLSNVSPEGTFIPPSPPEKTSFLSRFRLPSAATSSASLSGVQENDSGFVIPRESFDGYRRSFDIRPSSDGLVDGRPSRSSLDLLSLSGSPRKTSQLASIQGLTPARGPPSSGRKADFTAPPLAKTVPATGDVDGDDDEFEEVKLDDESAMKKKHFWQRSTNTAGSSRRERAGDANELRAFAVPGSDDAASHKHHKENVPSITKTEYPLPDVPGTGTAKAHEASLTAPVSGSTTGQ